MNKKGQMEYIGVLVVAFVAIIIGIAMFQSAAQSIGSVTNTVTATNISVANVNLTPTYITTYQAISGVTMLNASNGYAVGSGNYTLVNNVVYNGALSIKITPTASANLVNNTWYLSGTAEPIGYISDGGARGVIGIVLIFIALAIAIVALTPTLRSGVLDLMS